MIPQTAARTPPSAGVDPLTGIAYSEDTTYTYLYSSEITTLNYLTSSVAQNQKALANFADTLVEYDAYGNVVPCLAESWTQSDDGLTWTFNLRKDAKWFDCGGSEGAPVTANDFVYAARLVADPKFDSDMPDMLIQYIENGVELYNGVIDDFTQLGVEAADDYTLVYHLRQPCAYFVTLLAYGCYLPISGEFYESLALENPTPVINDDGTEGDPITNDFGTDRDKILYCGGYLCSTWLTQEKFTWVKNEKYWDADNIFITKVDYIVSEGLMNIHPEMSKEERTQKVSQALLEVGLLPEFASRFPHEFSGGQRQRIGIARSLIMEPEFIIADEPISALDVSIRAQVLNLLSRLQKERGLTYLFIAHDLSVMRFICDRIAVIHKGVIVEQAEAEQLFAHPLHPYTRALLSAIPMPDPESEKKKVLEVYDPSQHHYDTDKPAWTEIEPGHFIMANQEELAKYKAKLAE